MKEKKSRTRERLGGIREHTRHLIVEFAAAMASAEKDFWAATAVAARVAKRGLDVLHLRGLQVLGGVERTAGKQASRPPYVPNPNDGPSSAAHA
jgi:hypothetical protein